MKFLKNLFYNIRVRTPTIIQMEMIECGATSLAIILGYFKKFIPQEELRKLCSITRDGSSAFGIIKGAKELNLQADGYKRKIKELYDLKFPLILFWKFNHFVVLEGYYKKGFYINDPATGARKEEFEEFNGAYTGVTIEFAKTKEFSPSGKPFSLKTSIIRRFKNVVRPFVYSIITSLSLVFPGLILPILLQIYYDQILSVDYKRSYFFVAFLLVIIFSFFMNFLQNYIFAKLNSKSSIFWSSKLFKHILRLPIKYYLSRYAGELANRLYLNDSIAYALTSQLTIALINLLFVLVYLLLIVQISWQIALVALISALLSFLMLKYINRARSDNFARFQMDYGKMIGVSVGVIRNIETLKSCGGESAFFSRWLGYFSKALLEVQSINLKDIFLTALPPLFQMITIAFFLLIGATRVIDGKITIGMMLAMQMLLINFLTPIIRFVNLGQTLQETKSEISRVDDVLDQSVDRFFAKKQETSNGDTVVKLKGFLEVNNLKFGYDTLKKPFIEDLSFVIEPGQIIAFVGAIGCGKSTIMNLIKGIYSPWNGNILFDGNPIENMKNDLFLRSLSSVDQNIFLFEGSFKDNITLWDDTISEETIIKAAKDACIHDEIIASDLGYNAIVYEEGRNLSGGQKQRIEIARALVKNPTILLLDEATASVDSDTEKRILQNLQRRGCSLLMVAHRLSTLRDADEIMVLEKGKVIQRGNHEKLKNEPGKYQQLVKSQGLA